MERDTPALVPPGPLDRPAFLRGLAAIGASCAAPALVGRATTSEVSSLTAGDRAILGAAAIAEALAVTTYTHIIAGAPFYQRLFPQDQAYLQAARQQEMAHYLLVRGLFGAPSAVAAFYYPRGMFASAQRTVDTLVALEEAFIAAYLVAVRGFSTPDLRVAAARIMGVESDHRTMARVMAPGLDPRDGGPLRAVTGSAGRAEVVDPACNNGYERTLGWTHIEQAVAALRPFVDPAAAAKAGFDATKRYAFVPFTPTLPTPLGAF